MDPYLLERLSRITPEEREYLEGRTTVNRELYIQERSGVVAGEKLLEAGKLIAVRPHSRFIYFPEHTHDYVEMVYMCQGSTTHTVNGETVHLETGELLILGQAVRQAILPAGEGDIAVNLIVRPAFFTDTLPFLGEEDTPLRAFLVAAILGQDTGSYLHFRVAEVKPIQNLLENLVWTLITDTPNKRRLNQLTMSLLFVQLLNHTDRLAVGGKAQGVTVPVLSYIETHYASGSLTEVAALLHYDVAWLSREVKKRTGRTFTALLQEKRLSQAAWFLTHTGENVADIAAAVGYENVSYFHRLFQARYGLTPRAYRMNK